MSRISAFAAVFLALAPATGWAAFARVEFAPSAPSAMPSAASGSAAAALVAPSLSASGAALPALAPAFAVPDLAPTIQAAPELALSPAAGASPASAAKSAPTPDARGSLQDAAHESAASIGAGLLFDGAPAAPDFTALSSVRAPQAPVRWAPRSTLLKPLASAVNAWNAARHEQRLAKPLSGERVTTEEHSLRETLTDLHAALADGRYQEAISAVGRFFQTRAASSWYQENPVYAPYRAQAFAYMRFAERAVLADYGQAHRRSEDRALIAEARDAARAGRILGHAWRPTAIQEKDSAFCVQNALFNAIMASVGFARPTGVADFVAASRAALNREAKLNRPASETEIARLARELDVNFGRRDVAQGMDTKSMAEWAAMMGLTLTPGSAPNGDAGWSALFVPGREVLLSLRMFHPKYRHSDDLAALRGHDYMVLHHEVYLLGAFDSPSRGARLYLLQDSGSGRTLMATAEELGALTQEVQFLSVPGPAALP